MLDLAPPAQQLRTVVDGISDDQLPGRTPCANYRVSGLVNHVLGLTVAFRYAADKDPKASAEPPGDPEAPAEVSLPADWRERIGHQLDELVSAWRNPAAWEGETEAGGVQAPAAVLGRVALQEIVIHGWDLARATGQDFECDQVSQDELLALLRESASAEGVAGLFGPMVVVAEDAPTMDRIIGFSGRDPHWRPA